MSSGCRPVTEYLTIPVGPGPKLSTAAYNNAGGQEADFDVGLL